MTGLATFQRRRRAPSQSKVNQNKMIDDKITIQLIACITMLATRCAPQPTTAQLLRNSHDVARHSADDKADEIHDTLCPGCCGCFGASAAFVFRHESLRHGVPEVAKARLAPHAISECSREAASANAAILPFKSHASDGALLSVQAR